MGAQSFLLCMLCAPICASASPHSTVKMQESGTPPSPPDRQLHEIDVQNDPSMADPPAAPPQLQLAIDNPLSLIMMSEPAISSFEALHMSTPEEISGMHMRHPVATPFIVSSSTVRGPVSAKLQAQLEGEEAARSYSTAGATRALLHGARPANRYPRCGACRIVQCRRRGRRTFCSGHCRQRRKLFDCDTTNIARPACARRSEPTLAEVMEQPASNLTEFATAVVTAEAPYIGCAEIANRPTGCPARGTRATFPGRQLLREAVVLGTACRREHYVPDCPAPLFPFGVCECFYRRVGQGSAGSRRMFRRPCRTTDLAAGSGVGEADGSPSEDDIVVVPGAEVTQTWFSNFTELGQGPEYVYNVTASVQGRDVHVSLSYFPEEVFSADSLQDGIEIEEEYIEDYEPDPELLDYRNPANY